MSKVLSIDPSGTGTSGICLIDAEKIEFKQIKSPNWERHLEFVINLCREWQPNVIVLETSSYVKGMVGKHMISLMKIVGTIEALKYFFPLTVFLVQNSKVKARARQIKSKEIVIPNLEVDQRKWWTYQKKLISVHQLDSLIIYQIFCEQMEKEIDNYL